MTVTDRQHETEAPFETVHQSRTVAEPASVDILSGHKEIARFLGFTPRQVSWHDEQGLLPTFKIGRKVCARRSQLVEWIERLERDRQARRVK